MPFEPRAWILRVLACAVWLAPLPCAAQEYTWVRSQTTLRASASPDGGDCFDNGVAAACPLTATRNFDSGALPLNQTFDVYEADAVGRAQLFDSQVRSSTSLNGGAYYGTLRGSIYNQALANGTYVDAGGLAFVGEATARVVVSFGDNLTLHGAAPGGPVSIKIEQEIASNDLVLMRGSDNYPIVNFCLANGDATTSIEAFLDTIHLSFGGPGDGEQTAGYLRRTNECSAPVETGAPTSFIQIDGTDGDMVVLSQTLTLDSYVFDGGGNGVPNRVILAQSSINASNSAHTYVEVLTPGASFTSNSGALYQVPESGDGAGQLAADAALLALVGLRRSIGPRATA